MLIGPAKTLREIEEQMAHKLAMNKMRIKEISTELGKLHQEYSSIPKLKNEPPTPRLVELVNQIRDLQNEMDELQEQSEHLVAKLEEAEKDPNKDRKIILSLKDLLELGFDEGVDVNAG